MAIESVYQIIANSCIQYCRNCSDSHEYYNPCVCRCIFGTSRTLGIEDWLTSSHSFDREPEVDVSLPVEIISPNSSISKAVHLKCHLNGVFSVASALDN